MSYFLIWGQVHQQEVAQVVRGHGDLEAILREAGLLLVLASNISLTFHLLLLLESLILMPKCLFLSLFCHWFLSKSLLFFIMFIKICIAHELRRVCFTETSSLSQAGVAGQDVNGLLPSSLRFCLSSPPFFQWFHHLERISCPFHAHFKAFWRRFESSKGSRPLRREVHSAAKRRTERSEARSSSWAPPERKSHMRQMKRSKTSYKNV